MGSSRKARTTRVRGTQKLFLMCSSAFPGLMQAFQLRDGGDTTTGRASGRTLWPVFLLVATALASAGLRIL
jgi:hypothetical protein